MTGSADEERGQNKKSTEFIELGGFFGLEEERGFFCPFHLQHTLFILEEH